MTENTQTKRPMRLVTKLVLAAVISALLVTTAFAATNILSNLKGGELEQDDGDWYVATGAMDTGPLDRYELKLDIEINPDAPDTIETFYLPTLDEGYVQFHGYEWKTSAMFMWTNGEKNYADEIRFTQWAGGEFDPGEPFYSLFTHNGVVPQEKLVVLGGVQGYLIEDDLQYGSRHFFWSNGDYVFQLEVPDEYSDDQLAAVVESVHSVEDITPYIIKD